MAWVAVMCELRAMTAWTCRTYWLTVVCDVDELDEVNAAATAALALAVDDELLAVLAVAVDDVLDELSEAVAAALDVLPAVAAAVVPPALVVAPVACDAAALLWDVAESRASARALSRSCPLPDWLVPAVEEGALLLVADSRASARALSRSWPLLDWLALPPAARSDVALLAEAVVPELLVAASRAWASARSRCWPGAARLPEVVESVLFWPVADSRALASCFSRSWPDGVWLDPLLCVVELAAVVESVLLWLISDSRALARSFNRS